MKRTAITIAAAGAALAFGALPAQAAPSGETLPLDCGSDGTYRAFVNGNGEFTPARDTGSTMVVIPVSFQDFHFVATAADGTVLVDDTDASVTSKGGGNPAARSPRRQVSCEFSSSFTLVEADEGFPAGTTLSFSGHVTGYLTPAR